MTANRLRVIGLALLVLSLYIGEEIGRRHWTWVVFLLVIPATLGFVLVRTSSLWPRSNGSAVGAKRSTRRARKTARLVVLVVAVMPGLAYGQAAIISSRPPGVPDATWIERHCAMLDGASFTSDAARDAAAKAKAACATYRMSSGDNTAQNTWLRAILALQNEVGPSAMRSLIPQIGPVLPDNLDSYSLFLVPDDRWRGNDFKIRRETLWMAFLGFGQSIGDTRVAVWLLDDEGNVDVLRSQEYCRKFGLNYNDGPYIVTSNKPPQSLQPNDEVVVIRMGGIAPERIPSILNRLSSDLSNGGRIGRGALVYEEIKQRLITLFETHPDGARAFLSVVTGH